MSALILLLLSAGLLATIVLQIVILVRLPKSSAPTAPVLGSRAALLEAEDAASAQVFEEMSELAGNLTALDAARSSPHHGGPLRVARALAIVHIAMADAVASTTRAFWPYTDIPFASEPASTCSAVVTAAYTALFSLYPSFEQHVRAAASAIESRFPETDAIRRGRLIGHDAALRILARRGDDGANHAEPLAASFESTEPGKWRRDPIAQHAIALGGLWAERVAPFVIESATQFRVPPPPALASREFALEFAELLAVGGDGNHTATMRDEWGTMTGLFWAYDGTGNVCAPPRLYMQLLLQIARQRALPMMERIRMLSTAAVVMADAGLAAWDSKYHYRRARPVTFVRQDADVDGNDATYAVANWQPLGAPASNSDAPNFTPPFPAYPSGHAVFGSAVVNVVRNFLLHDQFAVSFVSSELDGVTRDNRGRVRQRVARTFDTGTQIELENADSRIQLGIHWHYDCAVGMFQGAQVGQFVSDRIFRPLLRSA